MGSVLQHQINIAGVLESNEAETSRAAGLGVLHDHAVHDFSITGEMPQQIVVGRFPAQPTDKHFPVKIANLR